MSSNLPNQLFTWLNARQRMRSHRQLLVIAGEDCWAREAAKYVVDEMTHGGDHSILWVGETGSVNGECIQPKDFRQALGQEYDLLVYDAFSGLRASAMLALSGTVKRAGLMILITPEFTQWPYFIDPELNQRMSFGVAPPADGSHFSRWLARACEQDSQVARLTTNHFVSSLAPVQTQASLLSGLCKTPEQNQAVSEILRMWDADTQALLISADRGRGKSSALGIAAAQLLQSTKPINITITAPTLATANKVFEHASRLLPDATITPMAITMGTSSITFRAIDALIDSDVCSDLLMIDEAAAIPTPQLRSLSERYDKLVFSTTIHGYEGTGRGFEYRFKPFLKSTFARLRFVHLSHPVRWDTGDCLEAFWFKALLMTPPDNAELHQELNDGCQLLEPAYLANHPEVFFRVFQLLVQAHYQTTPDDIVRMLDATDTRLITLIVNGEIAGVALLAIEGGAALTSLADAIAEGTRRPKGHLSAQKLAFEHARPSYATASYLRIVRIAVQPGQQRRGLGSELLFHCQHLAAQKNAMLTTSYGVNQALLRFWLNNGFTPFHLGMRRDGASAEYSVLMGKATSPDQDNTIRELYSWFRQSLAFSVLRWHKNLDDKVKEQLLKRAENPEQLPAPIDCMRQLTDFTAGTRPLDPTRFALSVLMHSPALARHKAEKHYQFIWKAVVEDADIAELNQLEKVTGKRELTVKVRQYVKHYLVHYSEMMG